MGEAVRGLGCGEEKVQGDVKGAYDAVRNRRCHVSAGRRYSPRMTRCWVWRGKGNALSALCSSYEAQTYTLLDGADSWRWRTHTL